MAPAPAVESVQEVALAPVVVSSVPSRRTSYPATAVSSVAGDQVSVTSPPAVVAARLPGAGGVRLADPDDDPGSRSTTRR